MSDKGWITVHRKIQECWIWEKDEPFDWRSAWIDLLLLANHADKKKMVDGELITIKRGQRLTSIRWLSERWKWSRTKVTKFLDTLEKDGMLTRKSDTKKTLLTIENYGVYQDLEQTKKPPKSHQSDTEEPPQDTNNNDNNENNENNILDSKESNCQKQSFQQAVDAWNSLEDIGIKPVSRMSSNSQRYIMLNARLKQYGLESYLKAIDNIRHSDFLQGMSGSRPFIITFDWFVRPNNFVKVMDGNYNNNSSGNDYDKWGL